MKKLFLVHAFLFFALTVFAQKEDSVFIRRIADEILVNGKAYDDLRILTKQIGGRLSGSPQMSKAEQWGLKTMQTINPDRAWLQQCMVPHWVRGGKDIAVAKYDAMQSTAKAKQINPSVKNLDVLALGNSKGTGSDGITAAVIEIKSFEDLEAKKNLVKDKIVFYNYPFKQTFIKTFQAYGDAVRYRGQG